MDNIPFVKLEVTIV